MKAREFEKLAQMYGDTPFGEQLRFVAGAMRSSRRKKKEAKQLQLMIEATNKMTAQAEQLRLVVKLHLDSIDKDNIARLLCIAAHEHCGGDCSDLERAMERLYACIAHGRCKCGRTFAYIDEEVRALCDTCNDAKEEQEEKQRNEAEARRKLQPDEPAWCADYTGTWLGTTYTLDEALRVANTDPESGMMLPLKLRLMLDTPHRPNEARAGHLREGLVLLDMSLSGSPLRYDDRTRAHIRDLHEGTCCFAFYRSTPKRVVTVVECQKLRLIRDLAILEFGKKAEAYFSSFPKGHTPDPMGLQVLTVKHLDLDAAIIVKDQTP